MKAKNNFYGFQSRFVRGNGLSRNTQAFAFDINEKNNNPIGGI
jgi:hypothetical protein